MLSADPYAPAHRRRGGRLWLAIGLPVAALAVVIGVVLAMLALPPTQVSPRAQGGPLAGPQPSESIVDGSPSAMGPSLSATPSPSASGQASTTAKPSPRKPVPPCADCGQPPFAAAGGKAWKVTFNEEFDGSDYDHDHLTPCFDWNTGGCTNSFNNGREHYQSSQVRVSGGTAKLVAAPLSPALKADGCQNGTCTYKSGLLSTARPNANNGSGYLYKFTYGYVESRFKVPAGRGFFTAFWMLPTDTSFHYRSEIDILEMLGDDPSTMFMTYNYDDRTQSYAVNKGKGNNGACAVKDYSKDFVRMGVDWEPHRIAWYIDGKMCAQYTDASQIENGPMQIILNLMVDVDWQRRWGVGLADPSLTRQLEVDYLRVYQQVPA
ncbi:family 16 glycosylhydrolase [Hamadaea tsunoensis]|uniref:family 16 glycosylhydrolase n=1 Tax=Hamadaea tsunoensis TaxID=53368 RepID=UPI000406093F|nr:family 16 glycosylhydrolase [Hamadaea tsunoensis]